VTLETYIGNKRTYKEWNKLNCSNHVEMKLKWTHSWHWNDFSFARFDVHMAIWLTNSSWSCFNFSIEIENDEFKVNSTIDVSSIMLCISKKIV
jgi:hypothetical protein